MFSLPTHAIITSRLFSPLQCLGVYGFTSLPTLGISPPGFCYLPAGFLALGDKEERNTAGGAENQERAADGERPRAVIAGLRQVKAAGIDHPQGRFCVGGAVICQHGYGVAVHCCAGGQQVVFQMLLRHVLQVAGIVDDCGIPGVILKQTQHIRGVNVADFSGFHLGNYHRNVILQKRVAVVGAHFRYGIGIVLQTLDHDFALVGVSGHGDEMGGVGLGFHMVCDVVNALGLVQLCLDKVAVGIVVNEKF